jgi:magnesium-transporting ATPase (P-type)
MLNEYFFYEEIPNAIVRVQYDPNQSYWQGSEMAMYVVRFGFLIVIAVVIALWIWGFHYQLSKIRIAAQQLSEGKLDTRAPEGFFSGSRTIKQGV